MLSGAIGAPEEGFMDFEFSEDQKAVGESARRYLEAKCKPEAVRDVMDGAASHDGVLWDGLAQMGFAGITVPEEYGGLGLGYLHLCMVAEQLGRVLAPVPFTSVILATECLMEAGSATQKQSWLPKLAAGRAIGTLALADRPGAVSRKAIRLAANGCRLNGEKLAVADGQAADFAIVAGLAEAEAGAVALYLVDLRGDGIVRTATPTLDPSRGHANIRFENALAEKLGQPGAGWPVIERVLDRMAVITAFEQTGGADRALEMARDYALTRMAFGRPIGAFQAIKHMLADMYVAATLARSNAYYGAWALSTDAPELPQAAAAARISASRAFQLCAKNNIQTHGGMGFTWAFDCHLFYRRAALLALNLGAAPYWEDRLINAMRRGTGPAAGDNHEFR